MRARPLRGTALKKRSRLDKMREAPPASVGQLGSTQKSNTPINMIRRILVPLDLSPYSQKATLRACEIAKAYRAQVAGLTVLDTPEFANMELPFHASVVQEGMRRAAERKADAQSRIDDGLNRFAETCEKEGVPHEECEYQGVPAKCILAAANYYDLVVMGLRTFFHFETQSGAGDSLDKVLDRAIVPILAVPKHDGDPFKKVLVAYDGSPQATRALRALASFEPVGDLEVTLLMSDKDPDRSKFYLENAAAFLRAHRFKNVETVATEKDICDVVDEDYIDQVDLVVAGVHSRHFIKDFFVGSLARQLIDYGHTAVLLGQ